MFGSLIVKSLTTKENNACYLYSYYDCGNEVLRVVTLLLRLQVGVMAWSLLVLSSRHATFFLIYYNFMKFDFFWTNHNMGCSVLVFAVSRKGCN